MSESVPSVRPQRDGRRELQIPHATTTFSNRYPAGNRNVSVHRTMLGAADDCAEVNVCACRVKSDRDAEPCSEWDDGSGRREAPAYHGKSGRARYLKPVRARNLSRITGVNRFD